MFKYIIMFLKVEFIKIYAICDIFSVIFGTYSGLFIEYKSVRLSLSNAIGFFKMFLYSNYRKCIFKI